MSKHFLHAHPFAAEDQTRTCPECRGHGSFFIAVNPRNRDPSAQLSNEEEICWKCGGTGLTEEDADQ